MKRLAILGASGHGKVVADAAEACGWQEIAFYDDAWPERNTVGPWKVLGNTLSLVSNLAVYNGVIVGIGDNNIRADKQKQLNRAEAHLVSIIHPSAVVSPHASIGAGSVVFSHAVVNACAKVGSGVIINTGAIVEHDCNLSDFSHISPGVVLAGGVTVGKFSWVGAGASVRQLLQIGESAIVGMGAAVTKNVVSGTTVIGNPARAQS